MSISLALAVNGGDGGDGGESSVWPAGQHGRERRGPARLLLPSAGLRLRARDLTVLRPGFFR